MEIRASREDIRKFREEHLLNQLIMEVRTARKEIHQSREKIVWKAIRYGASFTRQANYVRAKVRSGAIYVCSKSDPQSAMLE